MARLSALVPLLAGAVLSAVEPAPAASSLTTVGDTLAPVGERVLRTLKWGAYGELHYNNFQGADSHNGQGANGTGRDMLELHRLVLMAEAELADRWRFVTEIEYEHAFVQNNQGEIEVEQAYIDWNYHGGHRARAGVMLVPISIGNLHHEPTVFHGVERPEFDRIIVPTTWYEGGALVTGPITAELTYTGAIQAGLVSSGFSADQGIRGARQKGYKSAADDLLYTGRLDWKPANGLWLAAAATYGKGVQDEPTAARVDSSVLLYTLEGRWQDHGWDIGLSWGQAFISDAEEFAPTAKGPVPERFAGANATVAYDVLRLAGDFTDQVYLFGRYEWLRNQQAVPAGDAVNEAWNAQVRQVGITWKPHSWVAIKGDYRDYDNDADNAVDSWNLGVGFAF